MNKIYSHLLEIVAFLLVLAIVATCLLPWVGNAYWGLQGIIPSFIVMLLLIMGEIDLVMKCMDQAAVLAWKKH